MLGWAPPPVAGRASAPPRWRISMLASGVSVRAGHSCQRIDRGGREVGEERAVSPVGHCWGVSVLSCWSAGAVRCAGRDRGPRSRSHRASHLGVDHLNRAKAGKRYSISASRAAVFRDPKPSNLAWATRTCSQWPTTPCTAEAPAGAGQAEWDVSLRVGPGQYRDWPSYACSRRCGSPSRSYGPLIARSALDRASAQVLAVIARRPPDLEMFGAEVLEMRRPRRTYRVAIPGLTAFAGCVQESSRTDDVEASHGCDGGSIGGLPPARRSERPCTRRTEGAEREQLPEHQ